MMSGVEPAPKGTTIFTVRLGQSWAAAGEMQSASAVSVAASDPAIRSRMYRVIAS
jgi:hypothetical protein